MRTAFDEAGYRALGFELRKQILTIYDVDSCLATVRATVDALRPLGVDVYPLCTTASVVNAPLYDYAAREGHYPAIGDEDYPEGGYGVQVGTGTDPSCKLCGHRQSEHIPARLEEVGMPEWADSMVCEPCLDDPALVGDAMHAYEPLDDGFSFHLVAIVDRKWMLDFSIDQATRLEHGIELDPLVVPVGESFLRGHEAVVYRYQSKDAPTYLYYYPYPSDKSYRGLPNWDGDTAPKTHIKTTTHPKRSKK